MACAVQDVVINPHPTSSEHLLNLTLDIDFSRFDWTVPVDEDAMDPSQVSCAPASPPSQLL